MNIVVVFFNIMEMVKMSQLLEDKDLHLLETETSAVCKKMKNLSEIAMISSSEMAPLTITF